LEIEIDDTDESPVASTSNAATAVNRLNGYVNAETSNKGNEVKDTEGVITWTCSAGAHPFARMTLDCRMGWILDEFDGESDVVQPFNAPPAGDIVVARGVGDADGNDIIRGELIDTVRLDVGTAKAEVLDTGCVKAIRMVENDARFVLFSLVCSLITAFIDFVFLFHCHTHSRSFLLVAHPGSLPFPAPAAVASQMRRPRIVVRGILVDNPMLDQKYAKTRPFSSSMKYCFDFNSLAIGVSTMSVDDDKLGQGKLQKSAGIETQQRTGIDSNSQSNLQSPTSCIFPPNCYAPKFKPNAFVERIMQVSLNDDFLKTPQNSDATAGRKR
jgi:hypothetical protein